MAVDVAGRPINVGDFVFHYNSIYEVLGISENIKRPENSHITIMIYPSSKTSKKKYIFGKESCVIPREDMLLYQLKKDYT